MEGTRPVLVEIQALVSGTKYGPPSHDAGRRPKPCLTADFRDAGKRTGLQLIGDDVFVNIGRRIGS